MDKQYIFNNWDELTQSELFLGHVAYPTRRLHNWYTWMYLAEIKTNKLIKIGITNSLARRKRELEQREPPAVIKFAWSMPCPAIVERAVKQMLGAFIVKRKEAIETEAGLYRSLAGSPHDSSLALGPSDYSVRVPLVRFYTSRARQLLSKGDPPTVHGRRILDGRR